MGSFGRTLAVANLDDDKKPDGAVLVDSGRLHNGRFKLQLHFTDRPNIELTFESTQQALTVAAWDIDNDGDTDLVVEEAITHKPLYVWINEGHGVFREGRVQDLRSLAFTTNEGVQSPCGQPDSQALCLSTQRGFELAILTTPLLARPPSTSETQARATHFSFISRTRAPNPPRAPPLS
jgi:hypothetical protein